MSVASLGEAFAFELEAELRMPEQACHVYRACPEGDRCPSDRVFAYGIPCAEDNKEERGARDKPEKEAFPRAL